MVLTFIAPCRAFGLSQLLDSGEDCHNRLSALALSEVGEDLYGLKRLKARVQQPPRCGAKTEGSQYLASPIC